MVDVDVSQEIKVLRDDLRGIFSGPHPADVRESLRQKLSRLGDVAREVYLRDNIVDPETPIMGVVETVLYHFDARNRLRVAVELGMSPEALVTFLAGVVLGDEIARWRMER